MAFPKKGTRKIIVNDIEYLWRVKAYNPDRWEQNERSQIVVLVQPAEGGEIWSNTFYDSVKPKMVEKMIRKLSGEEPPDEEENEPVEYNMSDFLDKELPAKVEAMLETKEGRKKIKEALITSLQVATYLSSIKDITYDEEFEFRQVLDKGLERL